jgi:hypothetical protein
MITRAIEPEDMVYSSRVWRQLSEHITKRLLYAREKLESCSDMTECVRFQAEIRLLKGLLNLPETGQLVLDDNKEKEKRNV